MVVKIDLIRTLVCMLLLTFCTSCASPIKEEKKLDVSAHPEVLIKEFQRGEIIPQVISSIDPSISYALYLPGSYDTGKKCPILIFFDAQARGSLPLELYKDVAEKFGYILIGSNNSKNGNPPELTKSIISGLLQESTHHFSIDTNRIYAGGFSGGGRVAVICAMQNPIVKGVIGIGAGFPSDQLPPYQFRFIGIVGKEDFNYLELTKLDELLSKNNFPHFLFTYNGKHDWCPNEYITNSFEVFESDAMRKKVIPQNHNLLTEIKITHQSEAKKLTLEKRFLDARNQFRLILECLKQNENTDDVIHEMAKIENTKNWSIQQKELMSLQKEEEKLSTQYIGSIGQDLKWWNSEVEKLQAMINQAPVNESSYMLKRVLASISVRCYSYSQQLINTTEMEKLFYIIALYKIVDPENKDPWYFSAVLESRNNQNDLAIESLLKAVKYGFNDRNRLMKEAAFSSLQSNPKFIEVLAKIRP